MENDDIRIYPTPAIDDFVRGYGYDIRARLAFTMIEKWGMVTLGADGEDSAGRQKARLLSPRELVERAFQVAEAAVETAEQAGYLWAPALTEEQAYAERGRLENIQSRARFDRGSSQIDRAA